MGNSHTGKSDVNVVCGIGYQSLMPLLTSMNLVPSQRVSHTLDSTYAKTMPKNKIWNLIGQQAKSFVLPCTLQFPMCNDQQTHHVRAATLHVTDKALDLKVDRS